MPYGPGEIALLHAKTAVLYDTFPELNPVSKPLGAKRHPVDCKNIPAYVAHREVTFTADAWAKNCAALSLVGTGVAVAGKGVLVACSVGSGPLATAGDLAIGVAGGVPIATMIAPVACALVAAASNKVAWDQEEKRKEFMIVGAQRAQDRIAAGAKAKEQQAQALVQNEELVEPAGQWQEQELFPVITLLTNDTDDITPQIQTTEL